MLRRFAGSINKGLDLGELSLWYDASDSSSIVLDVNGDPTRINNKGILSNAEMIFTAGDANYISNAINGLNVIRGDASIGCKFSAINLDKSMVRFLHTGNYSIYFIVKWNVGIDVVSSIMTTKIRGVDVGNYILFDNRQSSNITNAIRFLSGGLSTTFQNFDNQQNVHLTNINIPSIDSEQASLYKNGNLNTNFNWDADQDLNSTFPISIGDNKYGTDASFRGDLCEIKVFKGIHNQEQRENVSSTLKSKWGII